MGCGGSDSGDNEVKETSYEIELSKITNEEWNRFKGTYQPLFDKLSKDITSIGKAEKNTVAGLVNAGVTKTYGDAEQAATKNIVARGLDPSSGAITMGDIGREKSEAVSTGMVKGQSKVDDLKVAGTQNLVNMARGDAGEAMQGISSLAGDQVQDANQKAISNQQARNDNIETASSVAGMGIAYGANNDWFKKPATGNSGVWV